MGCCFYIFLKLLNIKAPKKLYFQYLLFLLFVSPVIYALRQYAESLSIILMFSFFALFSFKVKKLPLNLSVTTSVISFGISYIIFLVATFLVCTIEFTIEFSLQKKYSADMHTLIYICAVQLLFVIFPFRIKRFKKGMPFLVEYGSSDVGVYISVTLLIAASFLGLNKDTDLVYLIPVFFSVVAGLTVLFWWRNSITKKYLEKVKTQELQTLQETITKNDAEIEYLKQNNNELSKIIHKDNKLIPALEYAVRHYLLTAESENDYAARVAIGNMLLSQIETASHERRGIITSYESNSKSLPSTGVPSVDSLLTYMLQKCKEQLIDFNLSVSGSIKYLVENIATEQDINTLLADLIENAIIATKKCASKNVLVHIGITDNCYSIGIFDNGIPFTPETINAIGLKRTTTHAFEGGSGIGLMTTFEILRKYQASFVIEDIAGNVLYTKNVSLCFDNLSQFRIKSDHMTHIELFSEREDRVLESDIGA